MTSALARFQDAFFEAALLPPDAPVPAHLRSLLDQPGFAVYRNTVLRGCVDALQANYPAVHALVGNDWFQAVAARYARAYPPQDSRMRVYGEGFAVFLDDFLRDVATADDLPYLPGVACLDRLWSEAHGAADGPVLAAAAVAALPLESLGEMVLVPHPAARWRWFKDQPIYTIWRRNQGNRGDLGQGDYAGEDSGDELIWTGEGVLLTRPTAAVTWTALSESGCAFLDACAAGHPLAQAVSEALAREASTNLAQLMAGLLNAGAFCSAYSCANQAINHAINQEPA